MTAPVVVEPISEVMAMTAPVISEGTNKEWIVSFVMPNEYSLETLPRPNNKNIKITSLPKERYVAIVFSGLIRESSYIKQIKYLEEFIAKYRIETIGKIQIARYDPPWILPFFRRNELMIKIK
jgi:effector-binding domain-containing protein